MIPIARRNDPSVLKSLLKRAKNRIEEFKMSVVIFPEGTRTAYQEDRKGYQSGIAALYGSLNVPVVPVALNSGKHWSRNAFIKFPGTISIEFLPAIQPGLNRQEFMEKLEQQIESATAKLG